MVKRNTATLDRLVQIRESHLRSWIAECHRNQRIDEAKWIDFSKTAAARNLKAMFSSPEKLQKAYAKEYEELVQQAEKEGFTERILLGQDKSQSLSPQQSKRLRSLQNKLVSLRKYMNMYNIDQDKLTDDDVKMDRVRREYQEIIQQADRDGFSERQLLGRDVNGLNDYDRERLKKYQERFQGLQAWMKKAGVDSTLVKGKDEKETTCRDEWYKLRDSLRDELEWAGLDGVDDETMEGYLFGYGTKQIGVGHGYGKSKDDYKKAGMSDAAAEYYYQEDYNKRLEFYKIVKKYVAKARELQNWIQKEGVDIDDLTDVRVKHELGR